MIPPVPDVELANALHYSLIKEIRRDETPARVNAKGSGQNVPDNCEDWGEKLDPGPPPSDNRGTEQPGSSRFVKI